MKRLHQLRKNRMRQRYSSNTDGRSPDSAQQETEARLSPAIGQNKCKTDDDASSSVEEPIQLTREEQLALIDVQEEPRSDGEDCELHVYERRYDTRGEEIYLRACTKSKFAAPKRRSNRACLVLKRFYTRTGKQCLTELEIQSRYIVNALKEVIGSYPGVDLSTEFPTIQGTPMCLFHYREELRHHAKESDNPQLRSHMKLCLQYMETLLQREIEIFNSLTSNMSVARGIEHRHLWMLFKPGCLIYAKENDNEMLSRLRSISYEEDEDFEEDACLELSVENVSHYGSTIG